MAYASTEQVTAQLAGFSDLSLPTAEALERLIDAAERAVDRRLGAYLGDPVSGRKLAVELLDVAQRQALIRAVAVAVGHLSELDSEQAFGLDDFAPSTLVRVPGAGLARRIDAELAGAGLVARSGCAMPDPVLAIVDPLTA